MSVDPYALGLSFPPDPPTLKPAVQTIETVDNKKPVPHEFQQFTQPLQLNFRLRPRKKPNPPKKTGDNTTSNTLH